MEKLVKVYHFDPLRARSNPPVPLDLIAESRLELGDLGPDKERKEVQRRVGRAHGRRVRGCSSLVGGGYSVVLDPAEPYVGD